jgi:hypothetical protein
MMKKAKKTKMAIGNSGIVDDVFSCAEVEFLLDRLSKLPRDHLYHTAITPDHMLHSWFDKKVFSRLRELTDEPIKLLFGGLINEEIPQRLHADYYYKSVGEPYKAFLIPISVENQFENLDRVHTITFNELDTFVDSADPVRKMWKRSEWDKNKSPKANNAMQYYDQHLSHLRPDDLECLTVESIVPWQLGSVVYWNEKQLHCSDNFVKNNINSKQAIVVHTYVL